MKVFRFTSYPRFLPTSHQSSPHTSIVQAHVLRCSGLHFLTFIPVLGFTLLLAACRSLIHLILHYSNSFSRSTHFEHLYKASTSADEPSLHPSSHLLLLLINNTLAEDTYTYTRAPLLLPPSQTYQRIPTSRCCLLISKNKP